MPSKPSLPRLLEDLGSARHGPVPRPVKDPSGFDLAGYFRQLGHRPFEPTQERLARTFPPDAEPFEL